MAFYRQWKLIFCKEIVFLSVNAEFARTGAEEIAAYADMVAKVEQFPEFEAGIADRVFLYVELQALPVLLQVREPGFAHQSDSHDASGNAHVYACGLEFFAGLATVRRQNLRDGMAEVELVRISGLPESFNLLQLLAADLVNAFVK